MRRDRARRPARVTVRCHPEGVIVESRNPTNRVATALDLQRIGAERHAVGHREVQALEPPLDRLRHSRLRRRVGALVHQRVTPEAIFLRGREERAGDQRADHDDGDHGHREGKPLSSFRRGRHVWLRAGEGAWVVHDRVRHWRLRSMTLTASESLYCWSSPFWMPAVLTFAAVRARATRSTRAIWRSCAAVAPDVISLPSTS